jgi:two-component system response regulator
MPTVLRVLILEDSSDDTEMILRELRQAGFDPRWQRVETGPDFRAGLDPALGVILADYSLPRFDALAALRQLQECGLDVPFLVVTGSVSEEAAVECMKQGATDYLLKDRLARLGPAVARALEQRRLRAEKVRSEAALRESERRFRLLAENATDMISRATPDGIYLYASPACRALLGYEPEELVGCSVRQLSHPDDRVELVRAQAKLVEAEGSHAVTHRVLRKDGRYVWFETTGRAVRDPETGGVLEVEAVSRDVTQRKLAEERLRASLTEKEVLLREIHHRVKNNLQVVSSLLRLQSRHVKDEQARAMLKESQNRVRSMALIHEKLYRSEDLARVDMAEYLHSLTPHLVHSAAVHADDINLKVTVANVFLGIDTAIPCGLIINELVSNSLKHAFPPGQGGDIWIDLQPASANKYALTVADNGVGFPGPTDFQNAPSLGLQLVSALADQLGATVEHRNGAGTSFRITFEELRYEKRG